MFPFARFISGGNGSRRIAGMAMDLKGLWLTDLIGASEPAPETRRSIRIGYVNYFYGPQGH